MLHAAPEPTPRRGFLARLAAGAAAFAAAGATPSHLLADSPSDAPPPSDKWLEQMKAKHRQIFDMPQPAGGLPLIHVRNYLNAYRDAYGLKPGGDVKAAVSLYFMTTLLAFNDAMWSKYKIGELIKVNDTSTKAPATTNVFYRAPEGSQTTNVEGMVPMPVDASISSLQSRGGIFLLCNNAFNFWMGNIAKATNGDAKALRQEFEANLLPGIITVPAMVVAFDLAQENGISYMYLA